MNSKDFGKKVAVLRKEKGLTQSELAQKLNVSNKAVSRWETGEGFPEITILPSLAKELGVTVDDLLNDFEADEPNIVEEVHNTSQAYTKKVRNEIPFEKPYWKSLTVFNKIGTITLGLNIGAVLIYLLFVILSIIFDGLPALFFIPVIIYGFAAIAGKFGLIVTIIGLLAGLFELYDKQTKVSIAITLMLLIATYVLPLIVVSSSMFVV